MNDPQPQPPVLKRPDQWVDPDAPRNKAAYDRILEKRKAKK